MRYGIDNLDEDNSKMENTVTQPAAAVEDDNGFFVVPNHFSDSDSDIEVIEIESTSSEYSFPTQYKPLVFFEGLLDTYPIDSRIIAKLRFDTGFKKSPEDRVLLLPSGWHSLTEAVSTGLIKNNHVIFDPQNLPKKLNEFYHLCYSSPDQTVPGVSDAFTFQDITDHERMVSQVGLSSSRVSYIINSLWTSLVVESDEATNIPAAEVDLPSNLMMNTSEESPENKEFGFMFASEESPENENFGSMFTLEESPENKELGSTSTSEENIEQKELGSISRSGENKEKNELGSGFQVQEVTVLMEKQDLNDTIPNEGKSSDNKSGELQQLTVMKKLVEKMEECDFLKKQVTKLESELTMAQNFVEYMIAQKDERFERLSADERNAHKSVYNMMKSPFEHSKLNHYMEQERIEYQLIFEDFKDMYENKILALKQARAKEVDELKRSHQKDIEVLQNAHKQAEECLKHQFEEKSQECATLLVNAKRQQDVLEKNLKTMRENYEAQIKSCTKEYVKLTRLHEKTVNMNPNSSTSNGSYLADLRDKVRGLKRTGRSKKEDSK